MNLELFTQTGPGTYYNSTNLSGDELKEKRKNVVGQTAEVLRIFSYNPQVKFTPWEIWDKMGCGAPITSIRRAITNLESSGYLIKLDQKVRSGPYKDFSYTWMLNPNHLRK